MEILFVFLSTWATVKHGSCDSGFTFFFIQLIHLLPDLQIMIMMIIIIIPFIALVKAYGDFYRLITPGYIF